MSLLVIAAVFAVIFVAFVEIAAAFVSDCVSIESIAVELAPTLV